MPFIPSPFHISDPAVSPDEFHLASEAAQHVGKSAYLFRKLHAKLGTQQYTPALENAIMAWFLFSWLWNGDKETSKTCTGLQNRIEWEGLGHWGSAVAEEVSTLQSLILRHCSSATNQLLLLVCLRRPQFPHVFTQNCKLQPLFRSIPPIHRQHYSDSFTRGNISSIHPFKSVPQVFAAHPVGCWTFSLQLHLSTLFLRLQ